MKRNKQYYEEREYRKIQKLRLRKENSAMIATFEIFEETGKQQTEEKMGEKLLHMDFPCETACPAEVLICRDREITEQTLENFPNLKLIYILSVGCDRIPFGLLEKRGIRAVHTPGEICAKEIAEYVFAGILFFNKNLYECAENKRNTVWGRGLTNTSLSELQITVLGTGMLGREVAKIANFHKMKVVGLSRSGKEAPFFDEVRTLESVGDVLADSDFVVSTLPLTKSTTHIYNEAFFGKMKESSVFINVGRGKSVDEAALTKALAEKKIRGAVLDVFEKEPLPEESELWKLENLMITPHISGRIPNFIDRSLKFFPEIYAAYQNGEAIRTEIDLGRQY